MNIEDYRAYCLAKPGTTESFPFDEHVLVFKVMNKMFALTSLKKWDEGDLSINLKCDPLKAQELRNRYPDDIFPGYHMSKKHWNTVIIEYGNFPENIIKQLINHSYELVVSKLPKKDREQLKDLE